MGGGLIQLVAYGAQDVYLTSQPKLSSETSFLHEINITNKYKNFEIKQIQWYENCNESFTVNKFKELNEKYNNLEFITISLNEFCDFKIEKGNESIRLKILNKQQEISNKLLKENREINKKNKKDKKRFTR